VNRQEVERRFTYRTPDATRTIQHEAINGWNDILPEGREKSLALTALQEARMWANAAIATTPPA
jgi:hypothetical protein